MKLFPLLGYSAKLEDSVRQLMRMSVDECRKSRSYTTSGCIFSPTGGAPVTETELRKIADELTGIAKEFGYPARISDKRAADASWSEYLHRNVLITAHEAAKEELWQFFTCLLVPDLVRWRWDVDPDGAISDRWVTVRHRGRNCFGRLWWRCEILKIPNDPSPYNLVHALKEDELTQIMERPWLAGHRLLSRAAAKTLIEQDQLKPIQNRGLFFRDVQKRLLRLGAYLEFEALDEQSLQSLLSGVFSQAAIYLKPRTPKAE